MQRLQINPNFSQIKIQSVNVENDDLDLLEELYVFYMHPRDYEAHQFKCYWLENLDIYIPYKLVNMMIERFERSRRYGLSSYAEFRDCEDFIVKTDWFKQLDFWPQQYFHEDFFGTIIVGVRNSFDRKRNWEYYND